MEDERLEEKVFIELDTPSSVYGLAVSATRNVGYVASRHAINCFSCSLLSPFPDFATFFPFGEDSASDFVATTHTEVMSLQKLSLSSYSGSSFLSFVTYTPALDTPSHKSRKVLHICGDLIQEYSGDSSEDEDELIIPSIDQHISTLHSQYQGIELTYTPFVMYSTCIRKCILSSEIQEPNIDNNIDSMNEFEENPWKTMLLISGSDRKLHCYIEDVILQTRELDDSELQTQKLFKNIDKLLDKYLPELEYYSFTCCILCIDIKYYKDERWIAIGFQDGTCTVFCSKIENPDDLNSPQIVHKIFNATSFLDGPIGSVKFLTTNPSNGLYDNFMDAENTQSNSHIFFNPKIQEDNENTKDYPIHLVIGSPTGYAIFYQDLHNNKLDNLMLIPKSDQYDSVTSLEVIHSNSTTYLLIGNYCGEILFYSVTDNSIEFVYSRKVSSPIVGLEYAYLHPHGYPSLIVNTTSGIHFLELPNESIGKTIEKRLKYFEELEKLKSEIRALKQNKR